MSFKRKLLHRFESNEKRRRLDERDMFDKRFDEDIIGAIFKYFPLSDKHKLECVSKKWQRCVYREESILSIGLNDASLPITSPLVGKYPRVIKQLEANYRLINRLDVNMAIFGTYALPFINNFKKLKELSISGENSMDLLIDLFQQLPYRIKRLNFKNQFEVKTFHDFLRFSYNYSAKTKRIKLCFDEEINKQCIEHMVNYINVEVLKIESPLTLRNVKYLYEVLPKAKSLQFLNIQAKDLRSILENSITHPQLQRILLMIRPDNLGSDYKIKVDFKGVSSYVVKMKKKGYFCQINTCSGLSTIFYVKNPGFLFLAYETDIQSLLKSKFFPARPRS